MATARSPEPRWDGPLHLLVDAVCRRLHLTLHAVRSRRRVAALSRARRLVSIVGCVHLRRSRDEIAGCLGISGPAVSAHLVKTAGLEALTASLAAELRSAVASPASPGTKVNR